MASNSAVSELSAGNISFCKQIYNVLQKQPGNIFYSPTSLEIALALLYAGCEGETAAQIRNKLQLPESKEKTFDAISSTLQIFKSAKNVTLNVANGLFLQENYQVKQPYVKIAKKHFSAHVENVNFTDPTSVKTINNFVSEETKDKIKELFSQDSFDSLTRLVIVNAIYFKGDWALKFDPAKTFKGDFHLNKKETVKVDFMKQKNDFKIGFQEGLNADIVVLPYLDENLSMILVVPHEIDGLQEVEAQLQNIDFEKMVKETYSEEIILTMPKFKLTQTLELNDVLRSIGMDEMFSERANLQAISNDNLLVSRVFQKTYIEVNEEGAEAAAATGMLVNLRKLPLPPREVKVESPFLFFLYQRNGMLTFFGRVAKP